MLGGHTGACPREINGGGGPLLSEGVLGAVKNDLQLHHSLTALYTLPIVLGAPSLIHWTRNLRYETTPRAILLLLLLLLLLSISHDALLP